MIYIIKHRDYANPIPRGYRQLYVGDKFWEYNKENINELNAYINEATGLYFIWKNYKDDVIGLCHYRRFFINNGEYLKLQDAKEILKNNDIIITNNVQFERGIYEQLRLEMPNDEERLILDKYYNELCDKIPGLKEYFDTKEFAPKEMFVCKRRVMNKYCKWLFNIIIPITNDFIANHRDIIQKRMIGHLIERLFYFWIIDNNLKTYRMEYKDL